MAHVAGFTVAHDVSARDWQMRNGKQWLLGKTFDTFCPLGPALVTKDTIAGRSLVFADYALPCAIPLSVGIKRCSSKDSGYSYPQSCSVTAVPSLSYEPALSTTSFHEPLRGNTAATAVKLHP